jgi:hypothetical protein
MRGYKYCNFYHYCVSTRVGMKHELGHIKVVCERWGNKGRAETGREEIAIKNAAAEPTVI